MACFTLHRLLAEHWQSSFRLLPTLRGHSGRVKLLRPDVISPVAQPARETVEFLAAPISHTSEVCLSNLSITVTRNQNDGVSTPYESMSRLGRLCTNNQKRREKREMVKKKMIKIQIGNRGDQGVSRSLCVH